MRFYIRRSFISPARGFRTLRLSGLCYVSGALLTWLLFIPFSMAGEATADSPDVTVVEVQTPGELLEKNRETAQANPPLLSCPVGRVRRGGECAGRGWGGD